MLKKFRDNQIGNIFVTGNARVTTPKGKLDIPIQISSRYLGELPQEIGRKIRQALADNGVTYTSPKNLAAIQKSVLAKFKGKRGGLMTEKARKEIARLTQPGANPKSAKLKTALDKVAKGKLSDANFPLKEAEGVTVNLRFSFYRDPLAKADKKKKKKRNQK
ncbi:MAG TPA: hypothetical protein VHQ01_12650 [Pyrinomonadaceae bacterium]|nr:hypothetical protein [Pyrinomonadaceae bacterium]